MRVGLVWRDLDDSCCLPKRTVFPQSCVRKLIVRYGLASHREVVAPYWNFLKAKDARRGGPCLARRQPKVVGRGQRKPFLREFSNRRTFRVHESNGHSTHPFVHKID